MPTHWYSCKCIRHRMGTGIERLQEIDAAKSEFYYLFFLCALFSFPNQTKTSHRTKTSDPIFTFQNEERKEEYNIKKVPPIPSIHRPQFQRAPNPLEFAQPRLSRVKWQSSPARGYKFGCVCSYLAGHEDRMPG